MAAAWTVALPNSRTRAVWALALFAAVQLADAVMTFAGVERFGPGIEANALLASCMLTCGVAPTLIVAKTAALAFAVALHLRTQYLVLAALTVLYVFGAIAPWAVVAPF